MQQQEGGTEATTVWNEVYQVIPIPWERQPSQQSVQSGRCCTGGRSMRGSPKPSLEEATLASRHESTFRNLSPAWCGLLSFCHCGRCSKTPSLSLLGTGGSGVVSAAPHSSPRELPQMISLP